jgi:hypothetical protein
MLPERAFSPRLGRGFGGGGMTLEGGKGGGGGGTTQTTGTTYQTNIPEYAQPYVETMLGATQKQLFDMDESGGITGFKPYKPYSTNVQDYVAPFSPMQQQAQRGVGNLTLPGTYRAGADISGLSAMGSMGLAGQQAQAGQNYQNQATSMYGPGSVGDYMNPYIAQSLAPQLQQLNQQFGIKGAQEQSAATSAGAFGGSRNALMQGLNQQNQMMAQQQAIAQGYDKAFQAAQQAQQFGANLGLQGQQGAQQGLGQAAQAAGQMAGIGGQALEAQKGIYGAQATAGAQQQAQQQQMINQAITDYANAQQYPLMQLGTMSNMLRGLPMQSQTTNQYVAAPNPITQGIGLAGAGASIYNALGGGKAPGSKAGGIVGMKEGGIASYRGGSLIDDTESDLYDMPVENLQKELKSPSPTIRRMAERIIKEKTGKAGGGIIAFANPNEANNQGVVKEDPAAVRQAYIDAAIAERPTFDTSAPYIPKERNVPLTEKIGRALGIKDAGRQMLTKETTAMPMRSDGSDVPMVAGSPELIAAQKAPVNSKPVATPSPANPNANLPPAPTNVKVDDKGRADAAKQGPSVAPAPAAAPAGIKVAAPGQGNINPAPSDKIMPTAGIKIPGLEEPAADPYAKMSIEEIAAKKLGFLGGDVRKEERAGLMAERANAKDEARRAQSLRMAEFFAAWGSTPGNTITAGLNALKSKLPDFVTDAREEAKIRRAINKDIADLDKADRLEKSGAWDEAAKIKKDLATNGYNVWGKKVDYLSARETDKSRERVAQTGAESRTTGKDDVATLQGRLNSANENVRKWEDDNSSLIRRANRANPNNDKKIQEGIDAAKKQLNGNQQYQNLIKDRDAIRKLIDSSPRVQNANKGDANKSDTPAPGAGKVIQYDANGNRI